MSRRKYLRNAWTGILVGCLTGLGAATVSRAHGVQRLDNGRWFDGETFVERQLFVVEGVFRSAFEGRVDAVIDLEDRFIVPPFGDAHSHALADERFAEDARRFLANGVFYVANPNSIASATAEARRLAAGQETVEVTYALGGLTGPGGHPTQIYDRAASDEDPSTTLERDAYWTVGSAADFDRAWPGIVAGAPDFLKIYLEHAEAHEQRRSDPSFVGRRGLDPALVPKIVERAHEAGLRVAAHVTSAFDFACAVEAGVDEIAHLPLELLSPMQAERAAARGVVVTTTTLSHRPAPEDVDLDALHRRNVLTLRRAGVRLVLGTDSHLTVVDEAQNLVRLGAIDRLAALRLLTHETPSWIFPKRRIGAFRVGFEASFLALDGNPLDDLAALRSIAMRVKRGHEIEIAEADSRRPVAEHLVGMLLHRGADAALDELRRIERDEPEAYDTGEAQLNALGYAALQHQRLDDAVAVFAFIVERSPRSANAHDSLGDGYRARGDREQAIESYRRALEIAPDFAPSREKLDQLLAEAARRQ